MRNIIIATSIVFIAVIVTSYFYFSNLRQNDLRKHDEIQNADGKQSKEAESSTEHVPLWAFALNAQLLNRPTVCQLDRVNRFILVQDAYHILYAISADGQQLWNAQLPGPIVGNIQQLADSSLVFTTTERLYRIDTEGDPLPGFSLRLPRRATEGGATTSYENTKNIRIDVQAGNHLLSFDGRGRHLQTHSRVTNNVSSITQDVKTEPSAGLPAGCGPLSYYGPLTAEGSYLLCGKSDRKLYCYRYD